MLNLLILSGVLVSALSALFCRQTINALLSLITTFVMSAVFFSRLQIYFISATLIIVYVGAITMLFLYVIMFLDIKKYKKISKGSRRRFIQFVIYFWCVISWFIAFTNSERFLLLKNTANTLFFNVYRNQGDVLVISQTLYSYYGQIVLLIGFLLFITIVVATDVSRPGLVSNKK